MGNVLTFSKKQPFHEFLEEIKEFHDKGLTTNFICVYSRDYKEGEETKGFVGKNDQYWYARSTTECLGLLRLMEQMILDFIREQNEEIK